MCIMCLEIMKGKMTIKEGRTALKELVATTKDKEKLKHYRELTDMTDEEFLEKAKQSKK